MLEVSNEDAAPAPLKEEIGSDIKDPHYEEIKSFVSDYDEVFYEEEDEYNE